MKASAEISRLYIKRLYQEKKIKDQAEAAVKAEAKDEPEDDPAISHEAVH
jgi:hypothetical protein